MNEVTMRDLKTAPGDVVNEAYYRSTRSIITRHSKPVAAIVPIEDVQLLEKLEDVLDIEEAHKALADYEKHGGVALEDLKKELGI